MPNRSNPESGASSGRKRPSRRRKKAGPARPAAAPLRHTSLPTTRAAYAETRRWLLERHGSVCAYCERQVPVGAITLDHVTPRRGQDAYDRRDNLVLACPQCNGEKADKPILAFLLGKRTRAASLVRYGDHLTPMLRNLARDIAGPEAVARAERLSDPDYPYRD